MRNFVSAPVAAGAYHAAHKWDSKRALWHSLELDNDGSPIGVRCSSVKLESMLDDSTQYNAKPLSCPRCLKLALRSSVNDR